MRSWPMAIVAALAFVSAHARAEDDGGGAKAVEDVQAFLAQALKLDERADPGSPIYQALRDFAASLVGSKAFVESLVAASKPWMGRQDLLEEVKAGAYEAGYAGVVVLPKEDLEYTLRQHLRLLSTLDASACAKAASYFQLYVDDADAFGRATPDDIARMLAITRTVYLAGLAREPGATMPTVDEISDARNAALLLVPETELVAAAAFATNAVKLHDDQACAGARAYRSAVLDLPGDIGDTLRRHAVVDGVRKSMVARANAALPVKTQGFTPGPVGLRYPVVARRARIEGTMVVRISIDETGSPADVKVVSRKFNKPSVQSNGVVVTVAEMFDPVAERFFRAGRFKVSSKDGKAVPYVVEVDLSWSLK